MNQILVTKKLYITPELKRKKKIYKFDFLLSIFLVCILISLCIYAEYDRNKSEETSQEIMSEFNTDAQEDTTVAKNNILIVVLDDSEQNNGSTNNEFDNTPQKQTQNGSNKKNVQKTNDGYRYTTETEALLKISPTKFWGADPNEVGNFCIVGHNYRNTRFFSKVPSLENGDIIEITDTSGNTLRYSVYNKYEVIPEDLSCTSQLTNGRKEITLITCTNDSKMRVIVKARVV